MLQFFYVSDNPLLRVGPCCLILDLSALSELLCIFIGCWFVNVKIMVLCFVVSFCLCQFIMLHLILALL